LRPEQLEKWVLSLVDQVQAGHRVEDSQVELKAAWPEPKSAARRIAGHANAAGSDRILWVIGLDEAGGVVAATPTELATWWPKVSAEFNGIPPEVSDLVVVTQWGVVSALLFDVSRRPFVVRNPAFGTPGAGPVELEVPWRSGTATRTARRDEILRILVPQQQLPHLEVLQASADVRKPGPLDSGHSRNVVPAQLSDHLAWQVHLKVYVTPRTSDMLVLPVHKASVRLRLEGSAEQIRVNDSFDFIAPYRHSGSGVARDSSTVTTSGAEAVFTGPGLVLVQAFYHEALRQLDDKALLLTLAVAPAGSDLLVKTDLRLRLNRSDHVHNRSWFADKTD
jgi:hypothetical protein